ncbi:MAG: DUF3106 domain-containing protein [Nitrospirae bacterium]|nr:DUF3106 domain-containing protein [Nitrospirota bacterium]
MLLSFLPIHFFTKEGEEQTLEIITERNQENVKRWEGMTPEQRDGIRERYRKWRDTSPEDRETFRDNFRRFKDMPPEKKGPAKRQV